MVPREHPTSSVKNSIEISRICLKAMSPEMFRCYSRVSWLFSLSFVSFHPRVTTQICQMVVTSSRSDTQGEEEEEENNQQPPSTLTWVLLLTASDGNHSITAGQIMGLHHSKNDLEHIRLLQDNIWGSMHYSRTRFRPANTITVQPIWPLSIALTNDRKWTIRGLLHQIQGTAYW